MAEIKAGRRYRDDAGALVQVVEIEPNGNVLVTYPTKRQGGVVVLSDDVAARLASANG